MPIIVFIFIFINFDFLNLWKDEKVIAAIGSLEKLLLKCTQDYLREETVT